MQIIFGFEDTEVSISHHKEITSLFNVQNFQMIKTIKTLASVKLEYYLSTKSFFLSFKSYQSILLVIKSFEGLIPSPGANLSSRIWKSVTRPFFSYIHNAFKRYCSGFYKLSCVTGYLLNCFSSVEYNFSETEVSRQIL